MVRSTLCPLLLLADPSTPTKRIDRNMLQAAQNHIDTAKSYGLKLEMSRQLFDDLLNRFPWRLIRDPQWKQHVFLWQQAVLTPLRKCCTLHEVPQTKQVPCASYQCSLSSIHSLLARWAEWLFYWDAGSNFANYQHRNIGVPQSCDNAIHPSADCARHYRAHGKEDWRPARFPWMKMYSSKLPPDGDFPFEPDPRWRRSGSPMRGSNGGYLDRKRNEWIWDSTHNNHWDVQLSGGSGYARVTPDGQIL